MLIIPGIIASSYPVSTTSFDSIATVTVGSGGSSSISFTSIPSTYKHLQVRMLARTNRALTLDQLKVNFNSDTTNGNYYTNHHVSGDGTNTGSSALGTGTYNSIYRFPGANATASVFGASVLDILDYTSTNKHKTLRSLAGFDTNGTVSSYPGEIWFQSGLWFPSTIAAITQIDIAPIVGTLFSQYSHFALYGVK